MNDPLLITAGVVVIAGLAWWFLRLRGNDRFTALMAATHPKATVRSRAQLIDGRNHIVVALTLDGGQISYQNADVDGTIAVDQLDEVEYGSDLVTGGIADGAVLRLRSHGRAIEFLLEMPAAQEWSRSLPPHRMGETKTA